MPKNRANGRTNKRPRYPNLIQTILQLIQNNPQQNSPIFSTSNVYGQICGEGCCYEGWEDCLVGHFWRIGGQEWGVLSVGLWGWAARGGRGWSEVEGRK